MTHGPRPQQADRRLIIFTRCPEVGRCKTRLIPALGEHQATQIHEKLVKRTMKCAAQAIIEGVDIEVRYAGEALERLQLVCGDSAEQFDFRPQHGADLGQRLSESSETAFREGASKVAIIGTDCPQLTLDIIRKAFTLLDHTDVVLGPASDGGYYLIATLAHHNGLFDQIAWGECFVLSDTVDRATRLQLSIQLLPVLADLDRSEDLALLTD
jgi:rSAM/selenodomain-associated transferase 1